MKLEKPVSDIHRKAMSYTDYAAIARRYNDLEIQGELLHRAFELERQAAEMLVDRFDDQLTRSVMYRSAASLAMQCGEYIEAERLIGVGLEGNPPSEIARELRDLRKEVDKQHRRSNDALLPQTR
jgi:hypothetical protein